MSDANVPTALLDLARRHTRGDASPRRHQASRARVLDRLGHRRSSAWTALAIAGLVTGGGAAAFAGVKELRDSSVTPLDITITKTKATPSATPDATENENPPPIPSAPGVTISVTPAHASIYWDDKKLEDNPATLAVKADHKPHRIRVESPGYATKTQLVQMDSDAVEVELELKALPFTLGPLMSTASIIDADVVIEGLHDLFQICYLDAVASAPTMAGKATLVVHVKANGEVDNVEVTEKEGLSAKVTTCLSAAAADGIHFRTNDLPGSIRIPIAFRTK